VELVYATENTMCINDENDEEDARRHATLAQIYASLPDYTSGAFWHIIQSPDIPLEVLTRCLRIAISCQDTKGQHRVFELIILRTQEKNEWWVRKVLQKVVMTEDERYALMGDLRADLYEHLWRALMDPQRLFWEENFWHCLRFERQHVYRALLTREGIGSDPRAKWNKRIPRELVMRLDRSMRDSEGESMRILLEDERAQILLRSAEESDLLHLVLHLPEKLKVVILLVFWEGRSEVETARVLGISDRTVRNRIQTALKLLRESLMLEEELMYG